jgi:hypothetical protein
VQFDNFSARKFIDVVVCVASIGGGAENKRFELNSVHIPMHGESGLFSFCSFKHRFTRTKVNITIKGQVNVTLTVSWACHES